MEEKNNLIKKIDSYKTLSIASIIIFLMAIISFIISLITSNSDKLNANDFLYLFVMLISLAFFVIFVVLYIKSIKQLKKIVDNVENK